jgi:hypothetical protein
MRIRIKGKMLDADPFKGKMLDADPHQREYAGC